MPVHFSGSTAYLGFGSVGLGGSQGPRPHPFAFGAWSKQYPQRPHHLAVSAHRPGAPSLAETPGLSGSRGEEGWG